VFIVESFMLLTSVAKSRQRSLSEVSVSVTPRSYGRLLNSNERKAVMHWARFDVLFHPLSLGIPRASVTNVS
jgi:hypothetical protein